MATKIDSSLMVHDGGTVKDVLDNVKPLSNYTALRAYSGTAAQIKITQYGNEGFFYRDDADTTSADNGGTIIVNPTTGKRWKRTYSGAVSVLWFMSTAEIFDIKLQTPTLDMTNSLQSALNVAGSIVFPDGTFLVRPLTIKSNTVISLSSKTKLLAKSGAYIWSDCVINLFDGTKNVTIYGNGATIQMLRAEYPLQEVINGTLVSAEYRHCVKIYGSEDVRIYDLMARDAGGDGYVVGGDTLCRNIFLHNCKADNNRRQGLSITNVIGAWVIGGEYRNTNGLPPQRGIDVEPNPKPGYYIQNINILGVTTENNLGGGILVSPGLPAGPNNEVSVFVYKCTSIRDGYSGGGAFSAVPGNVLTEKVPGKVSFEDCTALSPSTTGISINRWNDLCPRLTFKNCYVYNAGSNPFNSSAVYKPAIIFRAEPNDTTGNYYGNFEITDCFVEDSTVNSGVATTYYPIYINNANYLNEGIGDVVIKNIKTKKKAASWGGGTNLVCLVSATTFSNVDIQYDDPIEYQVVTSVPAKHQIGIINKAISAATITLPATDELVGSSFIFRNDADSNLYIAPQANEVIEGYSAYSGAGIISRNTGSFIKIKAVTGGKWRVTEITGQWATSNMINSRYPMSYYPNAPTAGTWKKGDIVWNSAPSSAGAQGWECVADGTPGTWREFGIISGAATVATLRSAVTAGLGARSFVSDANSNVFNSVVVGGGTNKVPVFSDGVNWLIG